MKKLLFICVFISQFCFSQQKSSLVMSKEIVPIMEEFIKEGQDRGFYLRFFLMERIDSIVFSDFIFKKDDERLGIFDMKNKMIMLSPNLLDNLLLLKLTIYHEIGHVIKFSGEHSCFNCYDIMSEYAPMDLRPYTSKTFMKYKIDEYFQWLNKKQ